MMQQFIIITRYLEKMKAALLVIAALVLVAVRSSIEPSKAAFVMEQMIYVKSTRKYIMLIIYYMYSASKIGTARYCKI